MSATTSHSEGYHPPASRSVSRVSRRSGIVRPVFRTRSQMDLHLHRGSASPPGTAPSYEPFGFEEVVAAMEEHDEGADGVGLVGGAHGNALPVSPTAPEASHGPSAAKPLLRVAATPQPRRSGLSMRHVISHAPHVWLMHHGAGGRHPVRVRTFPSVDEFEEYCLDTCLQLPRRVLPTTRRFNRHKSTTPQNTNDDVKDIDKHTDGGDTLSMTFTSKSTFGVESESTTSGTDVYWLDIQSNSKEEISQALSHLHLADTTVEMVLTKAPLDQVVPYPSFGYVTVCIPCTSTSAAGHSGGDEDGKRVVKHEELGGDTLPPNLTTGGGHHWSSSALLSLAAGKRRDIVVSCIVYPNWIITVHDEPFEELGDLVKQIHLEFASSVKKGHPQQQHQHRSRLHHHLPEGDSSCRGSGSGGSSAARSVMRPGWVLSRLVEFALFSVLPDPTPLLKDIDTLEVEAISLTTAFSRKKQRQISSSISLLRRRTSRYREIVAAKEELLSQLLQPTMRISFISKHIQDAQVYEACQSQVAKCAHRIDCACDSLQSANGNFAAIGQLRLAQESHSLDTRTTLMAQITVVFAPPNMIAGLIGMNVVVPFATYQGFNLTGPWWTIVTVILCWLLFWSRNLITDFVEARRDLALTQEQQE